MKLWEILPQLKEGQTLKVTFKDGARDADIVYRTGCLRYANDGKSVALYDFMLEAEYEPIPQFIPFEEALAELRKGKTICCESEKYGKTLYALDDGGGIDLVSEILEGKWWVVD